MAANRPLDQNLVEIDVKKGKKSLKPQGSLIPIEHKSVEELRRDQLERLTAGFRLFAHFGFDEGLAGHITYRDPEFSDHFWVNPIGMHFSQIKVSDLLLVNHDGEVVQGERPVNRAAFAIHSRLHRARPDVNAAAHSHSIYGRTFSSLGKLIDPITQDSCAFFEDQALFSEFSGVVYDTGEGDKIAKALGDKKTAILQNHGLLTTGNCVDVALWLFVSMDRCCQNQLLAEATGEPVIISDEMARLTKSQIANDLALWGSFQPLYDLMLEKDSSFLD
jgi:ribulose-5-phosphate 4-epimerase/fuculose-1-phosphate aldolase